MTNLIILLKTGMIGNLREVGVTNPKSVWKWRIQENSTISIVITIRNHMAVLDMKVSKYFRVRYTCIGSLFQIFVSNAINIFHFYMTFIIQSSLFYNVAFYLFQRRQLKTNDTLSIKASNVSIYSKHIL